jgi:predicted Holliday junction resolvase-like endonuclease
MKRLIALFGIFTMIFVAGTQVFAGEMTAKDKELIQNLKHQDLTKRIDAAQKLAERDCKGAEEDLIHMLKNDKEFQARIVAATSLMKIGNEKALKAIQQQAENDGVKTARTVMKGIVDKMRAGQSS